MVLAPFKRHYIIYIYIIQYVAVVYSIIAIRYVHLQSVVSLAYMYCKHWHPPSTLLFIRVHVLVTGMVRMHDAWICRPRSVPSIVYCWQLKRTRAGEFT